MKKPNIAHPITFEKGMDLDTDQYYIDQGAILRSFNIEPVPGSKGGERRIAWGDEEIVFDVGLSGEDYTTVGGVVSKEEDFLIVFVEGGLANEDHILYYDGDDVKLLGLGPELELVFSAASERVHSAVIVDRKYLYWTNGIFRDTESIPTNIAGTPPKKINIEKHLPKQITYELVLNADAYLNGTEFYYEVVDLFGNVITPVTLFYTIPAPGNRNDIITAVFNALTLIGMLVVPPAVNTVDNPAPRLVFTAPTLGNRVRITTLPGSGSPNVAVTELDFWPENVTANMYALIKPCPLFPIEPSYVRDATDINYIRSEEAFQFRYRYIFDDDERSAWSPASIIPTNYKQVQDGDAYYVNDATFNRIDLNLNSDDKLDDPAWRSYIRKVEVAYRTTSPNGIWVLLDSYDIFEFDFENIIIPFYGRGIGTAIPSDEDADDNVQALKNYDFVPKITTGLEYVYDESGNGVLTLGGGIYDYNLLQAVAEVEVIEANLDTSISGDTQVSFNKSLKRGGKYKVAIAIKDWAGRHTPALEVGEINIPYAQGKSGDYTDNTYFYLDLNMLSPADNFGEAYQVLITENLNQASWWRSQPSANPDLAKLDLSAGDIIELGVTERANADYMAFTSYYDDELVAGVTLFSGFGNKDGLIIPEDGDRVQIMSWIDNIANPPGSIDPLHSDRETYNYKIAGYKFSSNTVGPTITVYVTLDEDMPDWQYTTQLSFEVYRPKVNIRDEFYYEYGPATRIAAVYGAVDLVGYGDVYLTKKIGRDFEDNLTDSEPVLFEYPHMYLKNVTDGTPDLGRVVGVDPNYRERFNYNLIRASDIFIPNSNINGLNAFRSTSLININSSLGPITKLILNQNVLLAITVSKTQPIYVSKDTLLDLSGGNTIGRTDKLFNLANELRFDLGTTHPESVVYEQGRTYALDRRKGVFWRYSSGSGQQRISDLGMFQYFQDTVSLDDSRDRLLIICGWDRQTRSLYVNTGVEAAVFKEEPEPRWVMLSNDIPELYKSLNVGFISSVGGKLYIRTDAADNATYKGVSYPAYIRGVFNVNAVQTKLLDAVEIHANSRWHVEGVLRPADASYPNGQFSQITPAFFELYNGVLKASVLRDQLDPTTEFDALPLAQRLVAKLNRGRLLKIQTCYIEFRPDVSTEDSVIRNAYIYYKLDKQTVE
jgi:hypothetical protein